MLTATQCENWCLGFRPGKACLEVQFQSKSLKALADLADSWSERRNKEVRERKSIIKHYTTTTHLWSLEMNRYVTYVTYCQIMSTAFWLLFYLVIPIFLLGSSCRSGSASWKGSGGRGAGFTMLSWRLRTAECEMQRIERIWKNDEIVMRESIWKMSPWHSATFFEMCLFHDTTRGVKMREKNCLKGCTWTLSKGHIVVPCWATFASEGYEMDCNGGSDVHMWFIIHYETTSHHLIWWSWCHHIQLPIFTLPRWPWKKPTRSRGVPFS